jgi:hypothetical protein
MWERLSLGDWVGIISLILAVPVGVMSHLLGHYFLHYLEKRKLVRLNATRQQAIQVYNRIKAFHNRTKDRYAYYLLLTGWAVICAIASSTSTILVVMTNGDFDILLRPADAFLFLLAFTFALFAVVLMMAIYETSRQLARFDDYKAELERKWGTIDETPDA